jgi:hypothetical protein
MDLKAYVGKTICSRLHRRPANLALAGKRQLEKKIVANPACVGPGLAVP